MYLFSPMVLVHYLKMATVKHSKYISQIDANRIYENLEIDMAQRYANAGKTVLLTLCYMPLVPSALFISLGGIFFEY